MSQRTEVTFWEGNEVLGGPALETMKKKFLIFSRSAPYNKGALWILIKPFGAEFSLDSVILRRGEHFSSMVRVTISIASPRFFS